MAGAWLGPLSWPPVEGRVRGDRLLVLSCKSKDCPWQVVGLPSKLVESLLEIRFGVCAKASLIAEMPCLVRQGTPLSHEGAHLSAMRGQAA